MNTSDAEGATRENPVRVISAVIFRDDSKEEVLLGVRNPTTIAPRHPGVLSTPTLRIPSTMFAFLIPPADVRFDVDDSVSLDHLGNLQIGRGAHYEQPHAFMLEALLARKLGLSGALTNAEFCAIARPRLLSLDYVEDPLGSQVAEWTEMLTYELIILAGSDCFPAKTDAYTHLLWANIDRIPKAFYMRDALIVDDTLNPFEVCIHGLCIKSAVQLIQAHR
jgi:hypothetical protein